MIKQLASIVGPSLPPLSACSSKLEPGAMGGGMTVGGDGGIDAVGVNSQPHPGADCMDWAHH